MPLHAEAGYLRAVGGGRVEWVLSHPTGITEIQEGTVSETADGLLLELAATSVEHTTTAVDVRDLRRTLVVSPDEIRYDLWMATADVALTHHLRAQLTRVAG